MMSALAHETGKYGGHGPVADKHIKVFGKHTVAVGALVTPLDYLPARRSFNQYFIANKSDLGGSIHTYAHSWSPSDASRNTVLTWDGVPITFRRQARPSTAQQRVKSDTLPHPSGKTLRGKNRLPRELSTARLDCGLATGGYIPLNRTPPWRSPSQQEGDVSASFRDHSISLCMSMGFCRTPMSCGYYDTCEREGEAVAFVDKGLRAIGQPSTYEQWALSQVANPSPATQSQPRCESAPPEPTPNRAGGATFSEEA